MNIRDIPNNVVAIKAGGHCHNHSHRGHAHVWRHAMSRRQFIRTAALAVGVGAALGVELGRPRLTRAHQAHEPVPIPGGFIADGTRFHAFGPGPNRNNEQSTITDFNGFIGAAYLDGEVTRTNMNTGEERTLPFLNSDMRFMKGVFRGTDGQIHHGAFAFVWLDVYDPSLGSPPNGQQIHDLNAGILPSGLFWTIEIPEESIQVNLGKGRASLEVLDLPILDYGTIPNALFGDPIVSGLVSFKVTWSGVNERLNIQNDRSGLDGGGFAGEFIHNNAQIAWTATLDNGLLTLASAPLETSSSRVAEIGQERNGIFFPS